MKSNTVILARVSSKSQEDEGYSLDSQLKLLTSYCETKSLKVIKVFRIAESASKQQSRKVFQELLNYITENEVTHIAVEKTDRFARNFRDAVAIDDWLNYDENRRLHAVKENLLLHKNAPSDVKFMWNIHLSVAKKYTDNLREEAKKGWTEKLAQGWLPSVPPPGYMTITKNGKRIHVPNPKTKVLIKKAFEAYLDPSHSISTIADLMTSMGVHTRGGRPYAKSKVQKMLLNPFYIGINRFNGKEYPGVQETFITKELYAKVQNKLHRKRPSRYRHHNPVFKNIIVCQDCKGLVTWQIQKGRFYGSCQRTSDSCKGRKMLREDRVEDGIKEMLEKLVCPSQEVMQWVADYMRNQHRESIEDKERLCNSIKIQIDRLSRMDEGLYDDKLAGDITAEKYTEKHDDFVARKDELEKRLCSIDTSLGNRLDQVLVLIELSQKAAQIYSKKTPQQKRLIITKLFKNLTFEGLSLSVNFTNLTQRIADNSEKSRQILGGAK
jgi:site-specific DNA recombinase